MHQYQSQLNLGKKMSSPAIPRNSSLSVSSNSNDQVEDPNIFRKIWTNKGKIAFVIAAGGFACFAYYRYHVCPPSQFLVKTGLGISDMHVARKTLQWPLQEIRTYNMNPLNYTFHLHNMSSEMVPFRLPGEPKKTR
jgi:hypothetical protein